ncbi:MAG TPA: TRAP transporter small permease [Desulfomonilaceae bacterium]|nr:TRAP transporter small permease [Desulfomonilaceae bacterium]HVN83025.1 TRAP transporter small permease [Terriglobia bacterium]
MEALNKVNEWFNGALTFLGGLALVLMTLISCVNMVLRLFGHALASSFELVSFLGALTVALPLGYTQIKKSHIAVDILSSTFSPGSRRIVVGISLVLGIILFSVAAWQVGAYAEILRRTGEVSETLRLSYYPFAYGVAIACGSMTFSLLVDLISMLAKPTSAGQ